MSALRFVALNYFFISGILIFQSNCAILKTVSSQNLHFVINANEYLLAVFVEADCQPCKDAEMEIGRLATSMLDSLIEITFVRVASTDIPKTFGITNLPAIIFYRRAKPIIYDGPLEFPEIEEWISFNRETSLKTLNDDNFEHLTQAATGATTGDWLICFCSFALKSCQNLQPIFETLASKLTGQHNVAYVDTAANPLLVERFSLSKDLVILFFRLGKVYEYSIDKIDIASLTSFAHGWYKNFKSENVPVPPSPFDQLVTKVVHILKNDYVIVWAVVAVISLLFLLRLLYRGSTETDSRKKQ